MSNPTNNPPNNSDPLIDGDVAGAYPIPITKTALPQDGLSVPTTAGQSGQVIASSSNGAIWITLPVNSATNSGNAIVYTFATPNPTTGWYWYPQPTAEPVEEKQELVEGYSCAKCGDFNNYATPNQEDGSYVCFKCRKGY